MLKYEGKFSIGTRIRSYDFEPMSDRPDMYVEGRITRISDEFHFLAYVIECDYDSRPGEHTRVGVEVFVPMEVSLTEFPGRVLQLD